MRQRSAFCGAALLVGSALTLAAQGKVVEKSYRVSGKAALQLSADDGSVNAAGCGGCDAIRVKVDFHEADPTRYDIIERQNGGFVYFELKHKPGSSWFGHGWSRGPELTVLMPGNADTKLSTGSGSVSLRQVRGREELHSGSGNVDADTIDGSLDAETSSGSLHLHAIHGELRANTGSGSVDAEGEVLLRRASTGSGSVNLTLLPGSTIGNDATVDTGSGSIEIRMARSIHADVHASTGSGTVHSNLPLTVQGDEDRQSISGALNGGGPRLRVTNGSGSITLQSL